MRHHDVVLTDQLQQPQPLLVFGVRLYADGQLFRRVQSGAQPLSVDLIIHLGAAVIRRVGAAAAHGVQNILSGKRRGKHHAATVGRARPVRLVVILIEHRRHVPALGEHQRVLSVIGAAAQFRQAHDTVNLRVVPGVIVEVAPGVTGVVEHRHRLRVFFQFFIEFRQVYVVDHPLIEVGAEDVHMPPVTVFVVPRHFKAVNGGKRTGAVATLGEHDLRRVTVRGDKVGVVGHGKEIHPPLLSGKPDCLLRRSHAVRIPGVAMHLPNEAVQFCTLSDGKKRFAVGAVAQHIAQGQFNGVFAERKGLAGHKTHTVPRPICFGGDIAPVKAEDGKRKIDPRAVGETRADSGQQLLFQHLPVRRGQ